MKILVSQHIKKTLFLLLFLSSATVFAQTKITISAPKVVEVGEVFKVEYTVNGNPSGNMVLSQAQGFEQIGNASRRQGSQMTIINGQMSQSYEVTESYYFKANSPGTFRLPTARAVVGGISVVSGTHVVEVVGTATAKKNKQQQNLNKQINEDVFASVNLNKHKVYVGEAIYVTYKLYSAMEIEYRNHSFPDFTGFYQKAIDEPTSLVRQQEVINGKEFNSYLFKSLVAFPQKAGKLTVDPFKVDCNVLVPVGRSFWGPQYSRSKKSLSSTTNTVEVLPLPPGKPNSFNGAVGDFNMKVETDITDLKQNEAFSYKITISGVGNMSLIPEPKLDFPPDFEVYDPKVTTNVSAYASGEKGSRVFEYIVIPRRKGTFKIPAFEFSYFNPKTETYVVKSSDALKVNVQKGSGNTSNVVSNFTEKEDVEYFGEDIQYLMLDDLNLAKETESNFGTFTFYLWYIVPSSLLALLVIAKRKQIKQNQDIAQVRNRKANKESKRRLKQARVALEKGNDGEYYEEVANAIWGYIADKYTIQTADLTQSNIKDYLVQKNVANEHIQELLSIIQTCEMARFAPSQSIEGKEKLYSKAADLIQVFEQIERS